MKLSLPHWLRRRAALAIPDPASPEDRDAFRKQVGRIGEEAAVDELRRRGYRILERNYLARGGEVDIIAEHGGVIVFVEVKTRSPRAWASPESAVTPEKISRVKRAADRYLAAYTDPSPHRFDVVAILTDEAGRIKSISVEQHAFD